MTNVTIYFSPSGTTKQVVEQIASNFAQEIKLPRLVEAVDFLDCFLGIH